MVAVVGGRLPFLLAEGVQVPQDVRAASPIDHFRLGRLTYFLLSLCLIAVLTAIMIALAGLTGTPEGKTLTNVAWLISAAVIIFLSVGRFHDVGSSGWWCLLLFVPILGLFVWLYLLFSPPEEHSVDVAANQRGSGPERVQLDLHNARNDLGDSHQELIDTPPAPTDRQLVDHLLALHSRIIERVESLEDWRIKSAQPLQDIAEEAEKSRTVSRKERFVEYRERLQKANVQINTHIERLLTAPSLVLSIADSLKSGHLDPLVGNHDIQEISAVLRSVACEQWPLDDHRGVLHRPTEEYSSRLKAYDRAKEIDRRQREQDRVGAMGESW
jgi:Protein of unknown function (DUF805)